MWGPEYLSETNRQIRGQQIAAAALGGYEWVGPRSKVAVYLGGMALNTALSKPDPNNSANGGSLGLKGTIDDYAQPRYHSGFLQVWGKRGSRGFPLVDLAKGEPSAWVGEASYEGIPALSACAMKGASFPSQQRAPQSLDHYYPATLQLLSLIAARMRYPSCLKD